MTMVSLSVFIFVHAFINSLSSVLSPKLISWLDVPSFVFSDALSLIVAVVLIVSMFGAQVESRVFISN